MTTSSLDNTTFSDLNKRGGSISIASLAENNPDEAAKLIKMLNLAASGSAGEAENAIALALRMAVKHDLDFSTLTQDQVVEWNKNRITEPVVSRDVKVSKGHFRRPPCFRYIRDLLDQHFNVFTLICRATPSTISVYGKKSDIDRATYVMFFLFGAFNRLWAKHQLATGLPTTVRDDYFRGIWIGFDDKLTRELEDAKEQAFAAAETQGERDAFEKRYALVTIDHKKLLEKEAAKNVKIIYSMDRPKPVRDWETFAAGKAEGEALSIREGLKSRDGNLDNKNHISG